MTLKNRTYAWRCSRYSICCCKWLLPSLVHRVDEGNTSHFGDNSLSVSLRHLNWPRGSYLRLLHPHTRLGNWRIRIPEFRSVAVPDCDGGVFHGCLLIRYVCNRTEIFLDLSCGICIPRGAAGGIDSGVSPRYRLGAGHPHFCRRINHYSGHFDHYDWRF